MSINPIDENSTPKTTGSLEELFRHHLGEEAAVPPRPMLWDQIDNSLLIRQNEIYRRRLVATRWVAAASILLATLAGTGWWAGRNELLGGAEVANTSSTTRTATPVGSNASGSTRAAGSARALPGLPSTAGAQPSAVAATESAATYPASASTGAGATAAGNQYSTQNSANGANRTAGFGSGVGGTYASVSANRANAATATRSPYTGFSASPSGRYSTGRLAASTSLANSGRFVVDGHAALETTTAARVTQNQDANPASLATSGTTGDAGATLAATGTTGVSEAATTATTSNGTIVGTDAVTTAFASSTAAVMPESLGLLASRQPLLTLAGGAALPSGLATVAVTELPAVDVHRWRYSASYAAGIFNPNVNFSRAGIEPEFDYNRGPAFGTDSPALTEAAATEYRNNLRPGLSQRIALLATRHLRGHWSLSTGAEFTQATAQSASSSAFVGEQLFDLGQAGTERPLRTTDFRYRMASIPLEVRYSNPAKRGWSIYGRLGGVVTALLGVRSDVQGDPEATRTYSITSTGGPYRRLMGSVRGGAGAQFRPATGQWAFSMGPVADLGLVALNAHPVQNYFAQSHPYSVGLEAAVEFGR